MEGVHLPSNVDVGALVEYNKNEKIIKVILLSKIHFFKENGVKFFLTCE
jgi:hypothetical protein